MKRQVKYNEGKRPLNADEKLVLNEVEQTRNMKIDVTSVQYERHAPRATLCIAFLKYGFFGNHICGITIRNRWDKEDPAFGKLQSFRRALNDYVDMKKYR